MAQKLTFLVGGPVVVIMYVLGIYLLASIPTSNAIPTPGMAVVGGVLAMFASLGVFVLSYVHTALAPTD